MDGFRYKCPFSKHLGCKKEFYRKDKLKEHILTHSANENLKCERCSRVFKRQSKLKQHESVCLSEDHPCKDCGHVTTSLVSGSSFSVNSQHWYAWSASLLHLIMIRLGNKRGAPTALGGWGGGKGAEGTA